MLNALALQRPTLDRATLLRGVAAGSVWGVVVSGALLSLSFYQCGTICLNQIVDTTALSMLAGIVAIGPIAMFKRNSAAPAQ